MEYKEGQKIKLRYTDSNVDMTGNKYENIREYKIVRLDKWRADLEFVGFVKNENPYLKEKNIEEHNSITIENLEQLIKERGVA